MRQRHAHRGSEHREHDDGRSGRQMNETCGCGRQALIAPPGDHVAEAAEQRNGNPERAGGCGCPQYGNVEVDQRGYDDVAAPNTRKTRDQAGAEAQACIGQGTRQTAMGRGSPVREHHAGCQSEKAADEEGQSAVGKQLRHLTTGETAKNEKQSPAAHHGPIHGVASDLRAGRCHGREDDGRKRRCHGHGGGDGKVDPAGIEQEQQRGYDHDSATDAEHAAENAGYESGGRAGQEQRGIERRHADSEQNVQLNLTGTLSMNLYQRIMDASVDHQLDVAFSLPSGARWTHAQLHEAVARCARVLSDAGVEAGDRVTVQVEKSAENIVLYLAVLRIGAVFVPLNTAYTDVELEYFLTDSQPRVLVCDPRRLDSLEAMALRLGVAATFTLGADGRGTLMATLEQSMETAPVRVRADGDLAAIVYTSGTTGRSKGAMLTHDNLFTNAATLRQIWGWQPDDVLLHALPIYHVHGLFVALHCALLEPSPILLLPRFDVDAVLAALPEATVLMGVPTFYVRLLADVRFDRRRCAHMRLFISGSAPLLPETFAAFEARTGQRILERYGMTEAGMITSNPLHGERVAGTVGYPLPDVEVRLRCPEQETVVQEGVGVLEIRGPNVFQGYWQQPERTAAEFREGWFVTGDLAQREADGRVSIVGRHKDLIISGGLNIYPREIEFEINQLPGIDEAAVIGVPHPDFGEAVIALVVASDDWPGEERVIAELRARLAGFKVPRRVLRTAELPRNAMGKVQKALLRDTHAAILSG